MPENKSQYIVSLGADKTLNWNAATLEANSEKLAKDFPDAQVYQIDDYDATEEPNEEFSYLVNIGNNTLQWNAATLGANKEKLYKDYPDAKVQKVSAWKNPYLKSESQIAKESLDVFRAENGSFMDDYEARDTAERKIATANAMRGVFVPPMEGAISGEERGRYLELSKQEEDLKKAYYNSPDVVNARLQRGESISTMQSEIEKALASLNDNTKAYAPRNHTATLSGLADENKEDRGNYVTAQSLLNDAIKINNAPSRYDSSNGFVNFMKGMGNTFSDVDFWTAGLTEIADNFKIRGVLSTVQEKLGNLNDLSEQAIDDALTDSEKKVLTAYLINADVQLDRAEDLSRAFQAGQSAAESAGFMAEFILTGGWSTGARRVVKAGAKKVLGDYLGKLAGKVSKTAVGKYGRRLAGDAIEAAARTLVMPSTYRNMSQQAIQIKEDSETGERKLASVSDYVAKGFADSFIEALAEGGRVGAIGGFFGDILGSIKPAKKLIDAFKKSDIATLVKTLNNTETLSLLRAGGWHGIGEEYLEEWYGAALRTITNLKPEALKDFATVDNQLITLTSFLPMTIIGGGFSTGRVLKAKKDVEKNAALLKSAMAEQGYSEEQANLLVDSLKNAPMQALSDTFTPMIIKLAEQNEDAPLFMKYVARFAFASAKAQAFGAAYEMQEAEQRNNLRAQIEGATGGKPFWQEDTEGNRFVETATLGDGTPIFILNHETPTETPTEQGTAILGPSAMGIDENGNVHFINDVESEVSSLDDYLNVRLIERRGAEEESRVAQEAEQRINDIKSQIVLNQTVLNMGTQENPIEGLVVGMTANGVMVQTQEGATPLTWDEVGNKLSLPNTVMTDAQIEEVEVANLDAQQAAREAMLDEQFDDPVAEETEIAEGEEAEAVAEEATYNYPRKADGSVDGNALWNENVREWIKWNNQRIAEKYGVSDNGADSVNYLQNQIASLERSAKKIASNKNKETDFDKKVQLEDNEIAVNKRLAELRDILAEMTGETAVEAVTETVAEETPAEPAPEVSESTESEEDTDRLTSEIVSLMDGTLTDSEIDDYINNNIKKAQKELTAHNKKTPKIGTDKQQYLEEKKKHQAKVEQIQSEIDFWNEVKSTLETIRGTYIPAQGEIVNKDYDLTPLTPAELVADFFGSISSNAPKIRKDSFLRHTGYSESDAKALGFFLRKNSGITMEEMAERIESYDQEQGYNILDHSDPMAGMNALLEAFSEIKSHWEMFSMIKNNRRAQAESEAKAAYDAMLYEIEQAEHMTIDEFETYKEVIARDIVNGALTDAQINELNSIFAEDYYAYENNEINSGRKDTNVEPDVTRRDNGIREDRNPLLQGEQFDNSGDGRRAEERSSENSRSGNQQDGNAPSGVGVDSSEGRTAEGVNGYGEGTEIVEPDNDGERKADSAGVAGDSAAEVSRAGNRSDIRVFEEGLESSRSSYSDASERDRREAESQRLINIAKANGLYVPIEETANLGVKVQKRTGESVVYINEEEGKVYKVKDPYAKSAMKAGVEPEDAIFEFLIHNILFPETAYTFVGITEQFGEVRIILSQDYVSAYERPTQQQIADALAERGLQPETRYSFANDLVSITDVEGDNVILGEDGTLYFIDPIIRFKKPVREILDTLSPEAESVGETEDIDDIPDDIWESSLDEDMPDFTNSASAYFPTAEMRQKFSAMRARINDWAQKLGVKVRIMETLDDVVNQSARKQILMGYKVFGFFDVSSGEVAIYLPDYLSFSEADALSEIDKTYIHEVVSHRGLRGLLGEEKYGEFCDKVWEAMTDTQRQRYLNYPGVNGNTRVAADEFIANFAESVNYEDNRTMWDKIVDFIKGLFNSVELPVHISNESLADLLRMSYSRLAKNAAAVDTDSNQQAEGNTLFRAEDGSLVGMHNISEEKLRKVLKQGGAANPSTAVIDIDRQMFGSYGEISFIMPSSLVGAGTGRNAGTFTADAWTPTYPQVSKRFSDDKLKRAYWRDISAIPEEMSHEVLMAFDSWLDNRNASGLAYMFLHERGEAPEMVRVEAKFPQEIKDKVSAILGEGRTGLYNLSAEEKQAMLELYIQENFGGNREEFDKSIADRIQRIEDRLSTGKVPSFVKKRITLDLQWMKEHAYDYDELSKFVSAITADIRHAGEVNDAATTNRALDYIKDNGLEKEFDRWKESLNDRYGIKEYLFDGYTPSGNQRWLPNTVENASRLMNKQGLAGATGMAASFNRFVATLAPKKKTLSDIRASKDRLVEDEKLVDDFREKWSEVFFDLGVKCQPDAKGYEDYGLARLTEAAQKKNPGAYLKKEYGVELSQEDLQKLSEMIKAIKTEFPARYFETKFQRPVYLNEFAAAVMPTTTSEDIKQAISDAGLPIFEYDSTVEGSRKEATLKATEGEGIRFRTRITPEMDKAYMDAVEAGDMETAQRMVIEAAKIAMPNTKVPGIIYHGTRSNNGERPYNTITAGHFTDDYGFAEYYANASGEGFVYNTFLNIERPLVYDFKGQNSDNAVDENGERVTTFSIIDRARQGGNYDGVILKNVDEYGSGVEEEDGEYPGTITDIIPLSPSQIKSAEPVTYDNDGNVIPLSERFNPENEDIRFRMSNENQAIFVSNAAKAVEGIKQEKATPEQWPKMIEKNGGLKAGEDKWMGLSDWLKASDKKTLTKQEVLDFINENMIVIEETHYTADAEDDAASRHELLEQRVNERYKEILNSLQDIEDYDERRFKAFDQLQEELGDFADNVDLERYGVYLTFSYEDLADYIEFADMFGVNIKLDNPIHDTRLAYTTRGLDNQHEIALTVPSIEPWNESDDIHFGDAGEGRAVAWIRFGDASKWDTTYQTIEVDEFEKPYKNFRGWDVYVPSNRKGKGDYITSGTLKDGRFACGVFIKDKLVGTYDTFEEAKEAMNAYYRENPEKRGRTRKVLVIDEIQSKRHQTGREKGYKSDVGLSAEQERLAKVLDAKYARRGELIRERENENENELTRLAQIDIELDEVKNVRDYDRLTNEADEIRARRENRDAEIASLRYEIRDLEREQDEFFRRKEYQYSVAVPDAPFDKNWHELAMKRMLRYAAENGYDVIAWTTGDQQAERYNIGHVVESFGVETPDENGSREVIVRTNLNDILLDVTSEGKIYGQHGAEQQDLTGQSLSDILGKELAMHILSGKYDGEESVDTKDIRFGGEGMKGFYDKMLPTFMNKYGKRWGIKVEDMYFPGLEGGLTMHSVPVTEEMKASVMEGQVMFRARGENESARDFVQSVTSEMQYAYPSIPTINVEEVTPEVAKKYGYTFDELKETSGLYLVDNKLIIIFAHEDIENEYQVKGSVYHESTHWVIKTSKLSTRIGKFFWDNADRTEFFKELKDFISETYDEKDWHEEMMCFVLSGVMIDGAINETKVALPQDLRDDFSIILNNIGYGKERKRSRITWKNTPAKDGGKSTTEKGMGLETDKGQWNIEKGLTAEERRIINEYFPGAFPEEVNEEQSDNTGAFSEGEGGIRYRAVPLDATPTDEVVAEGLDITDRQVVELAGNLFAAFPADIRKKITDSMNGNPLNLQNAIFAIPAELAEKESLNDEERSIASIITREVQSIIDTPMTRDLHISEALWMLYDRVFPTSSYDLVGAAKKAQIKDNLGFSERKLKEKQDDIRYRAATQAEIDAMERNMTAADLYNRDVTSALMRLRESFQDNYRSVQKMVDAVVKKTGKAVKSFEDIMLALNQLSSKNLSDKGNYLRNFLMPMWDAVLAFKEKGKTVDDVIRYVMLKHGLERNDVLAQRDARNYYKEAYDKKVRDIEADKSLSDTEKQDKKDKAKDDYDFHIASIQAGTDAKYRELRERDYGAIMALYSDYVDIPDRMPGETIEQFNQRQRMARLPKYTDLAVAEAEAAREVEAFENANRALCDRLWKRINAATKETLKHQYEHNVISKQTYDHVRGMFEFYIPLRGFKEDAAEDIYSYYGKDVSTDFANPLIRTKGRTTLAESPFGWIGSMAESAIQMDNKNDAKMRLYYFALNRPAQNLLTLQKTWYKRVGEDSDGRSIWEASYPNITPDMDHNQTRQEIERHDAEMKALAASGQATQKKSELNLRNSVVNISDKAKPEHAITVLINGEEQVLYVNGNPRAAQAINGMLNIDKGDSSLYRILGQKVTRWMSRMNTSYNPAFWISNYERDLLFTIMSINVKEDKAYRDLFWSNYVNPVKVTQLLRKYEKGELDMSNPVEKAYKEFADNGGITGFTVLANNEEYDKLLDKYSRDVERSKFIKGAQYTLGLIQDFGEGAEQASRFAAYMTSRQVGRSIEESIGDAKEVTVNFNRKGSGKAISWEETGNLSYGRYIDSHPNLKWCARVMTMLVSSMAPAGRSVYMFFNASIQGLKAFVSLYKKNPGKAAMWSGAYFGLGFALAALNHMINAIAGGDDDDYLDIPDWERRNNIIIGGNGFYIKWALPQEARPFYAVADIILNKALGRSPDENLVEQVGRALLEVLPVNPLGEGGFAQAVVPSALSPLYEIWQNTDYKGMPLYRESYWSTGEEPKYDKAFSGTGKVFVEISRLLNEASGGDYAEAGAINIHPAAIEHLIEGYGGGTVTFFNQLLKTFTGNYFTGEWTVRNAPFLNRVVTINDERYRNSHTSDVFKHYENLAKDTKRIYNVYKSNDDVDKLDELKDQKRYDIMKIYERYSKKEERYDELIRDAEDERERRELMAEQDEIRREMIKEISEL